MDWLSLLKFLHVIGSTVLLGTGAGIAFFMVMAHASRDPDHIARTAHTVVIADVLFTATAVVAQPITGVLLAWSIGWPLTQPWILASLGLYVFVGLFWLPVIWIQVRMRDLARVAVAQGTELSADYHRLFRIWFACGVPAFLAVLVIFWLMLTKPMLG